MTDSLTTSFPKTAEQTFDASVGIIHLNGQLIDARDPAAKLSPGTHGIHYSGSVFDGERAEGGEIFLSHAHSERLIRSAKLVGLNPTVTADEIDAAKQAVLEANNIKNGYVRAFMFRGPAISVNPRGLATHFCVMATPKTRYWPDKVFDNGISLMTSCWRRTPPTSVPQEAKAAANYQVSTLAEQEANAAGFDDALILDQESFVAEASVANIFFFDHQGVLHTPLADGRFLNGLTRQTVIEIARELGYEVSDQARIKPEQLHAAAEVFCTGSATSVTPVRQIDGTHFELTDAPKSEPEHRNFHFNVAGVNTTQIMNAYSERIRPKPAVTAEPAANMAAAAPGVA